MLHTENRMHAHETKTDESKLNVGSVFVVVVFIMFKFCVSIKKNMRHVVGIYCIILILKKDEFNKLSVE